LEQELPLALGLVLDSVLELLQLTQAILELGSELQVIVLYLPLSTVLQLVLLSV
jgi:hypothetical protein